MQMTVNNLPWGGRTLRLSPASVQAGPDCQKSVLIVTTSHDHFPNGSATGMWMNEFAIPYGEFTSKGIKVTVASPSGGSVPIDPRSEMDSIPLTETWFAAVEALQNSIRLSEVQVKDYDALFLPGGYGPMFDLTNNPDLQRIVREFFEARKLVSAVCHGLAGLLTAKMSNGRSVVAGRTLTGFTDLEEKLARLDQQIPYSLETELRKRGANFVGSLPVFNHIEKDGNLVTGQNPASSSGVARAVVSALSN